MGLHLVRRSKRRATRARAAVMVGLLAGLVACRGESAPVDGSVVSSRPGGASSSGAATTAVSTVVYDVGDPSTWWSALPADPRGAVSGALGVWDGRRVLSIGGLTEAGAAAGAAGYDPAAGRWVRLAEPPDGLVEAVALDPAGYGPGAEAVHTGAEVLFFAAVGGVGAGWRYDPAVDRWSVVAAPPSAITAATPMVWTGREVLVWLDAAEPGGVVARYDPAVDRWTFGAAAPVPYRQSAVSAWTGERWLLWGGQSVDGHGHADGASYDPVTGDWWSMAPSPLSPRRAPGVWTGSGLVVLGGVVGQALAVGDGAIYNLIGDLWASLPPGPVHPGHLPLWTGRYVLLFAKGGVRMFDARSAVWRDACCNDACCNEVGFAAGRPVWTGEQAIMVGSDDPAVGGVVFTPPVIDPPPVSAEIWNGQYAPSVGFDDATAWRFNAILGLRDGRFRDGIADVLFVGDRRVTITGDPTVIEQLRPSIEALGLIIDEIIPADSATPLTTAPAAATATGILRQAGALVQQHEDAPPPVGSPWPAGTAITLERCHYERDGRWIYQGTIAGIPSGTSLTLHLELGYEGIGSSRLVTATVHYDGVFVLSFDNHLRTATDCHISDPANPAIHSRIAQTSPSAPLTR